ncbi:phage tail tape measure protein [Anaerocolumna xylanovorans]|uniref:Phage tail tape measure protein, TP901 family, core region n=1 Tax=Anaerocolumna xylanovorans DSM 12503 TaxID=1121345 RepID=A0A1M7YM58_9FIRM|nr:phage tail tape measure protein [Anaerocolumna xylanovorans]SHO53697.1 phage tail tape measure protein, TP901 family, core region [Anaerocolumna xylanovorans DSM 12503]
MDTVLLQATLDMQKSQQEINKQIKILKIDPVKMNIDLDNKSAKKGIAELSKESKVFLEQNKSILKNTITSFMNDNPAFNGELKNRLLEVQKQIASADNIKLSGLENEFKSVTAEAKAFGKTGDTFFSKFKKNIPQILSDLGSTMIKQMISDVVNLDKSLVNLQIATGYNHSQAKELLGTYIDLGQQLGATGTEVADIASDYLNQGRTVAETNKLVKDSFILSKIGNMESADATSYLTTIMKGYNVAASDVIDIIDKLSAVDTASTADLNGLAEGMSKTAGSAKSAGVEIDKLVGYLAAISKNSGESMSSVGDGLDSIFSRMENIKSGKLAGAQNNGEDLSNVETVLKGLGVNLRDSTDGFRDLDDVLDEVAGKWDTYGETSKNALASSFAGTNHMEEFLVLMSNYRNSVEYANTATSSSGTAMEQFANYEESVEAKTKRLTASFQEFANNTLDSGVVKGFLDATNGIIQFADAIGAWNIALLAGFIALTEFSDSGLSKLFLSLSEGIKNFALSAIGKRTETAATIEGTSATQASVLSKNAESLSIDANTLSLNANTIATNANAVARGESATTNSILSSEKMTEAATETMNTASVTANTAAQQANALATGTATTATTMLGTAMKLVPLLAVVVGITAIVSGIKALVDSIETADEKIDKANKIVTEFTSNINDITSHKKNLEDLTNSFNELSKGVDEYGRNVSLTASEYEKYQSIIKTITDLNPTLITGYDEEGNILVKKNGLIQDSINLLKAEYDQKIKNMANFSNVETVINGAVGEHQKAKKALNEINVPDDLAYSGTKINSDGSTDSGYINQIDTYIADVIGKKRSDWENLSEYIVNNYDEIYANLDKITARAGQSSNGWQGLDKNQLNSLVSYFQELRIAITDMDTASKSADSTLQYVAMAEEAYNNLSDAQKNFISSYINGISITSDTTEQDIKSIRNNIIGLVSTLTSSDSEVGNLAEQLFSLDESAMSLQEYENQVDSLITLIANELKVDPVELKIQLGINTDEDQRLLENIKSKVLETNEEVQDYITTLPKSDLLILSKLDFNPSATKQSLQDAINTSKERASQEDNKITLFTDIQSTAIDDFQSAMSKIKSALSDTSSLSTSDILDLMQQFSSFDWKNYGVTGVAGVGDITNALRDLAKQQYDALPSDIESKEALTKLYIDTISTSVISAEKLAQQKEILAEAGIDAKNITAEEIFQLLSEKTASEDTRIALMNLAAQKLSVNNVALSTSGDLTNLIYLMSMANATTDALVALQAVKDHKVGAGKPGDFDNLVKKAQAEADTFLKNFNISQTNKKYSGKDQFSDKLLDEPENESTFSQQIDWISKSIDTAQKKISDFQATMSDTDSYEKQKEDITNLITLQNELSDTYSKAAGKYNSYYTDALKKIPRNLRAEYKKRIENGDTFEIEDFSGISGDTREQILNAVTAAQGYWESYQGVLDKIQGNQKNIIENNEKLKGIHDLEYQQSQSTVDYRISNTENSKKNILNTIDEADGKGTIDQYEKLKKINNELIDYYENKKELAQAELLNTDSEEEYSKINKELQDAKDNISTLKKEQNDWNNSILHIPISNLEKVNEELQDTISTLNDLKDDYNSVISAVTSSLDDQIKSYQNAKGEDEKYYNGLIKNKQAELEAFQATNDAREKELELQQAQYDLQRAQNQKVNRVYKKGEGFTYEVDTDAIKEAQSKIDSLTYDAIIKNKQDEINDLEDEKDKVLSSYDVQIDKLNDIKNSWDNIAENIKKINDMNLADMLLGSGWENRVSNGDTSDFNLMETLYGSVEKQLGDLEAQKECNEKAIQSLNEYAKVWEKTESTINEAYNKIQDKVTSTLDETGATEARTQKTKDYANEWENAKATVSTALTSIEDSMLVTKDNEAIIFDERITTAQAFAEQFKAIAQECANALASIQTNLEKAKTAQAELDKINSSPPLSAPLKASIAATAIVSAKKRHSGLELGYVGETPSNHQADTFKMLALDKLKPDEFINVLNTGEGVITPEQIDNVMANYTTVFNAGVISGISPLNNMIPDNSNSGFSYSIGELHLHEVQNVDNLADEIISTFGSKINQKIHR